MTRGVFVTGTDTGVGKTVASCALIHALAAHGIAAHPFKPIAAGAVERGGAWVNEDTLALAHAAGLPPASHSTITPILLREPMAPHIAAGREGRAIELAAVRASFAQVAAGGTFVVAEGVGGLRVPLGNRIDTLDLCRELALPLVLVVGVRLGCLNHALLTAGAIGAANLRLAGWIANELDPAMLVPDENVAALEARLGAPLLARFPHRTPPDPRELARLVNLSPLLE